MEDKFFTVTMEVSAPDKETVDKWLDRMPDAFYDAAFDIDVKDNDEPHLEARIRYVEDWNGKGEYYLLENRWSDEEWGLEMACPLFDYKEEKGCLVSYRALTTIRQWKKLNIPFHFC